MKYKNLICKQCGSNSFKKQNNGYVCNYCGTILIATDEKKSDIALDDDEQ